MFTKLAINYLRRQIVELEDDNERRGANNFLNLIERMLLGKKARVIHVKKLDDNKIVMY